MEHIIHYTSYENWELIKEDGFLHPCTSLVYPEEYNDLSYEIKELMDINGIHMIPKYLVGILNHLDEGWVEHGLMEDLIEQTIGSFVLNRENLIELIPGEVVLKVPIIETGGFVREHAYGSPKRFVELYGKDYWALKLKLGFSRLSPEEQEIFRATRKEYLESTISIEDYKDGMYEVPEIWLPQRTPVELLTQV